MTDAMSVHKPDWKEAKQRLSQWWETGRCDRVVCRITAPKKGAPRLPVRGDARQQLTDPETIFANLEASLVSTWFGAEALPVHFVYIGAVPMGIFLGAEVEFREESVWQKRLPFGWDEMEKLSFDPDNRWWRFFVELTRQSCLRAKGRWIVTSGGPGAIADVMANLFGADETLRAFIERPDDVRWLRDRMLEWTEVMSEELFSVVAQHQEGSADWLRIWAPGRYSSVQCDLAVMLSSRMFNDLFLEEIRRECDCLDHCLYHLDGVAQLRHLDALLSLEELDGIQWNPEPQYADPLVWVDVFRRIQKAGKKLYVSCPPEKAMPLLSEIDRRGVFLSISCRDEETGRELLRHLERLGV